MASFSVRAAWYVWQGKNPDAKAAKDAKKRKGMQRRAAQSGKTLRVSCFSVFHP